MVENQPNGSIMKESEARMGYRAAEQVMRKYITVMRNVIWQKGNTGLYYPSV